MRTLSMHYAGMIGFDNVYPALHELQRIASTHSTSGIGFSALRVAVRLAHVEKLTAPADALLELAEKCAPIADDPRACSELLYARAMLFDHVGRRDRSLQELHRALQLLEEHSINSSMLGLVLMGIGAVHCAKGQYDLAAERFSSAHHLGHRRGADGAMAIAASNLALCYERLGRYNEQVEWCKKGLAVIGARFSGSYAVQLHMLLGYGLALLGKADEAVAAIGRLDSLLPSTIPAWLEQSWKLGKADVLALTGRGGAARGEALSALTEDHYELHALSHAGIFARWVAITACEPSAPMALERIQPLVDRLEQLDALDQVEVLGARKLLRDKYLRVRSRPGSTRREERVLQEKRALLPRPTVQQLATLGLPIGNR
jgi:tetratricopeptide (TPR) repeat protein